MRIYDIIEKKRDGLKLTKEEIDFFVQEYTKENIEDYQASALLMAIFINGMDEEETVNLTESMARSGNMLDLSAIEGITADKHSTGGVGDKTSLVVAPICASLGIKMAKMSGRGLGHTGGTIDKLESIDGYNTSIDTESFINQVNDIGIALIGQTGNLAPADKKIYALRNSTGTVDSIPLICASIMSKKLALNADCLLLDVKWGSGAFMKTPEDAERLGALMEKVGNAAGKKCRAIITDMNTPLGCCIGNSLEIKEAVELLQGKVKGRLYDICIELTANMLELAGKGTISECTAMAQEAIASGKALDILKKTIEMQGGNGNVCDDTSLLPQAKYSHVIYAPFDVEIVSVNAEELGMASLLLGAGRISKDEEIDYAAGIVLEFELGDKISMDAPLMTLYSDTVSDFSEAALRAYHAVGFRTLTEGALT